MEVAEKFLNGIYCISTPKFWPLIYLLYLSNSSDSFTNSVTTNLQISSMKINIIVYLNSKINKQIQFFEKFVDS